MMFIILLLNNAQKNIIIKNFKNKNPKTSFPTFLKKINFKSIFLELYFIIIHRLIFYFSKIVCDDNLI